MPNYPDIISKKIKYDSPSGYVLIGKYIPPFEKIKNGFGYMGVVLQDYKNGKLLCSVCGEWKENIPSHLVKHKMSGKEYRTRFGLLQSTALKSKKMRMNQSIVMQKLRGKNKQNREGFKRNNEFAGNRRNTHIAVEQKNKFGVCNLQIMQKVIELKDELGKTPTLTQLRDRYGFNLITNLHSRYGSYIKLCRDMGMEVNFSSYNPKYSREYFIEKALSNEPSIRIFTDNEGRAFYKYFKGIRELRQIVSKIKFEE
jgi:uncharacterized Zn finger protein (UPF0148 family)